LLALSCDYDQSFSKITIASSLKRIIGRAISGGQSYPLSVNDAATAPGIRLRIATKRRELMMLALKFEQIVISGPLQNFIVEVVDPYLYDLAQLLHL
jgi:hypothetical protein